MMKILKSELSRIVEQEFSEPRKEIDERQMHSQIQEQLLLLIGVSLY